ncbi:hypothetical protein J5E65_09730, partial [Streptococcus pneumoniae]|nr:hypothetical protein [Streptococcus pneumoniae]
GQPMHAFDLDTFEGTDIRVREARDGEKLVTLDGEERDLAETDLVITVADKPVALAGVMGTEISEKYDIIVSNPPYISREDESEVGLNVLYSEPHLALFADEDGLAIYRRIAEDAKDYLKDGGKIYLEIGYKQGQSVPELFRKHLPEKKVRTLKDQFGQDRMVVVDDGQD